MIDQISIIILAVAMFGFTLTAMHSDLKSRRLPNWLTVSTFLTGLLFHLVVGIIRDGSGGAVASLGFSMAGFAVGFGILFVLWLIGGAGGGDVKFAGAVGAWLGPSLMLIAFIASAGFALVISLGVILWRNRSSADGQQTDRPGKLVAGRAIPYAVPLTLATWCLVAIKLAAAV